MDVDVLAADGLEHAGSHARVALHACADNADLRAVLVDLDLAAAKPALVLLQKRERAFGVVERDGEDQVLGAVGAGALQDDIHVDVALREQAEHLEGHAGHIRHPQDRDDCDVVVLGDAFDEHTFHFRFLLHDGSRDRVDAGEDLQLDAVFFGQLHAAVVEHLRAERGEFKHFVKRDLLEAGGLGDLARVGRKDALDIGIDLAAVGVQRRGQRHGRSIAAAAAERGDIVRAVEALEPGHNNHAVAGKLAFNALGVQALDARAGIGAVGDEAGLPAGQADGRDADLLQGHGQQGDGDLLAGGQQHIHLAAGRAVRDLLRFGDEVVGGIALRRDHDDDVVARIAGVGHDAGHVEDAAAVLDRSTAEFLYDQCHWLLSSPLPHSWTVAPVLSASRR